MASVRTLAIIVNYKAAALTLGAVRSVLDSDAMGPVKVVVVDNSADREECHLLRTNLPTHVELIVNPVNEGFGRACQGVFEAFPGEHILLLNPDARLLTGCLERLQRVLGSKRNAGAVSPQVFWDEDFSFYLPPSYPPFLFIFQSVLNRWGPGALMNRVLAAHWRRHAIKIWRSRALERVGNLSGGLVLLKSEALKEAGGLFDPRFFLYFEDTDMFVRMKKAGYGLYVEPRAEAVHYYDQCGRENLREKRSHMAESHAIFLEKHCKGWKSWLLKALNRPHDAPQTNRGLLPKPEFVSPFVLEVPVRFQKGWLFEWSPSPNFVPSMGRFEKGPRLVFSERYWSKMAPGRYFGRLGRPKGSGKGARIVSWVVKEGT